MGFGLFLNLDCFFEFRLILSQELVQMNESIIFFDSCS